MHGTVHPSNYMAVPETRGPTAIHTKHLLVESVHARMTQLSLTNFIIILTSYIPDSHGTVHIKRAVPS